VASAPIVLVPGFWLGAWAWNEVASVLRADGHDVTPPGAHARKRSEPTERSLPRRLEIRVQRHARVHVRPFGR
jgi:hypothetical protein